MAKTSVTDWDTTAANNTEVNSIDIDEGCAPSGINNAIREKMAQVATAMTTGGLSGIGHLAKSATYTVLEADRGKCIDCSAALTLNLTAAATMQAGWMCYVKADGGAVTVDPNSTEQIEGANTLTVADGTTALIYTDGTAWYVAAVTDVPHDAVTLAGSLDYITLSGQEITRGAIDLSTDTTGQLDISGGTNVSGDLDVDDGGTGRSTHTAYAVICGGTTTTAAQQSIASVGTSGHVLTSNGAGSLPTFQVAPTWTEHGSSPFATTSGTSVDATSIPSGVNKICVYLDAVSVDATVDLFLQLGDSGGVEATGYTAGYVSDGGTDVETAGFNVRFRTDATKGAYAKFELEHMGSNVWVCSWNGYQDTVRAGAGAGGKTLSGELDRIRLTTSSGTDNFDAGQMKVEWYA
jgi:hypothetical protein